jgi:hypothetical protein
MKLTFTVLLLFFILNSFAQGLTINYDENKIPEYQLPEVLRAVNGRKIKTVRQWEKIRRPELLELFRKEVYGFVPGRIAAPKIITYEGDAAAFGGKAVRKQIDLVFEGNGLELAVGVLMYLPKSDKPVPVILAYNFIGNHTVADDPAIRISESWVHNNPSLGIINNRLTEQSRGVAAESWPVQDILDAGFGLVTVYYGDIDPDYDDFKNGIHPLFYREGQEHPLFDEWGSVAAWAWGLSGVMDYLETDTLVNSREVVVLGHSRLAKAALWAVASDQRFAGCIANDSGCMGAAVSRRRIGETVAVINRNFPHWFCTNFKRYSDREDSLPVDQHLLLALIAPRPLYVASASRDRWSDPKGEFLGVSLASPAYELYGLDGLPDDEMPEPEHPVGGVISYHLRTGKHGIKAYDWQRYLAWAKKYIAR